jgi:predicted dehydrogenase
MGKPVRIGIVGAGFAAQFHLASYRKVYGESFQVAAICGRNTVAARGIAERYGVPHSFDSVEAMLRDPGIDVIDICIPNHLHVPLIIEAASYGKHIICEKPLGGYFGPPGAHDDWCARGASRQTMLESVAEQAGAVRSAIERAGVTFCYGENWVYAPPIAKVDRLLAASGSTIMRIEAEESHSGSHSRYALRWRTAGGGSLLRLGVHPIGAALHLKYQEGRRRNGRPIRPISVLAQVANLTNIDSFRNEPRQHVTVGWEDVEDWAGIFVTFEDGSIAQLTCTDTRLGGIRNYLTAHGSRAVASANINPNTMCQAFTPDGRYFEDEYIVEKTQTKEGWSFPAADEDAVTGYPEELRDFVGAIAHGRPPKSDLMLANDVLLTVYAGYLSAERGTPVDLRPWLLRAG